MFCKKLSICVFMFWKIFVFVISYYEKVGGYFKMKKIVSLAVLYAMTMPAFAAPARPSYIKRDADGGYNITYSYNDKAKTGWYVGGRAELSFLNWKNKYSSDDPKLGGASDKYSFEPVFGGGVFAGRTFGYFWRAELEAGYLGYFDDKGDGAEFSLSVPYVMANGYYDFDNGFYAGAGVGVAMPTTEMDAYVIQDNGMLIKMEGDNTKKTAASPMGGVYLGWSRKLDDNLVFDLRYRLAGLTGTKHTRRLNNGYDYENKIGLILDNSLSMGLRYEF